MPVSYKSTKTGMTNQAFSFTHNQYQELIWDGVGSAVKLFVLLSILIPNIFQLYWSLLVSRDAVWDDVDVAFACCLLKYMCWMCRGTCGCSLSGVRVGKWAGSCQLPTQVLPISNHSGRQCEKSFMFWISQDKFSRWVGGAGINAVQFFLSCLAAGSLGIFTIWWFNDKWWFINAFW